MGYQNPIFKAEYERAIAMAPSLRIVPKESSWLMRLIAPVMKIINPTWMTNYTTTLGSTLYMPGSEIDTYSGASVLCHEAVHIQQWRRWWILMALSYALLLPVVFTMRAYWEFYGYVESLRFIQRQGRVFDSDIEWAVSQFTSAAYGWMFPFPNYLRRKFREHLGIL